MTMTREGDPTEGRQHMEKIGHYTIVSELGRGGMGVVYKAHEQSLNRYVAIKVLGEHLSEDDSYVERFVREAQSAAKLNHPNLVQIYAINEEDGKHYFVMEYVTGTSLQQIMRAEGTMEARRAARIILQTAAGLREAHNAGVVHRDIKPGNIMITEAGLVKIADFGLALMAGAGARLTATGMFMGTPGYLSPEQCLDNNIDHRTDIYSLGVTFFEMLTGSQPFTADSPLALLRQIIEVEPPDARELNPELDDEVRRILMRMMVKDRDQRYASCEELIADLQAYLEGAGTSSEEVAAVAAGATAAVASPAAATATMHAGDPTKRMETNPVASATEPAAATPPPPPPGPPSQPSAPPTSTVEPPRAAESVAPQAVTPPPIEMVSEAAPEARSRTGLVVAAVIVVALLGVAAMAGVAWKAGLFDREPASAESTATDEVASLSTGSEAPAEATVESADPGTEAAATDAAATEPSAATTSSPATGAAADSAEASPVDSPAASAAGSGSATDRGAAAAGRAGAKSTSAARSAPPRQAPPPPPVRGTVVVGIGEQLLAGEAEAFVERALGRSGVEVIDERSIPAVMDLAQSGADQRTLMRAMRPHARHLVVINAEYLGDRPLRYMGRVEPAHQSRLTVSAFDLVEGRAVSKTWDEKMEYTQLTVERVVEERLRPGTRKLSRALAE
jgi:serine/threonine-protein kinase